MMPMSDLLRLLATGCPRLGSDQITDRCDLHYPDLSRLFGGLAYNPIRQICRLYNRFWRFVLIGLNSEKSVAGLMTRPPL
jgi:hypothetical protein